MIVYVSCYDADQATKAQIEAAIVTATVAAEVAYVIEDHHDAMTGDMVRYEEDEAPVATERWLVLPALNGRPSTTTAGHVTSFQRKRPSSMTMGFG